MDSYVSGDREVESSEFMQTPFMECADMYAGECNKDDSASDPFRVRYMCTVEDFAGVQVKDGINVHYRTSQFHPIVGFIKPCLGYLGTTNPHLGLAS